MWEYFALYFKSVFMFSFRLSDILSTIIIAIIGLYSYKNSQLELNMDTIGYVLLIFFVLLTVVFRIFTAPYYLWKDQRDNCEKLRKKIYKQDEILQNIGIIYDDMVVRKNHSFELGTKVNSYLAYEKIKSIYQNAGVDIELKSILKDFIKFFRSGIFENDGSGRISYRIEHTSDLRKVSFEVIDTEIQEIIKKIKSI